MQREDNISAAMGYAEKGETRAENVDPDDGGVASSARPELLVLVELVVVEGPEGQKLHAIQSEAIYRILARLAERQLQCPEKESRL